MCWSLVGLQLSFLWKSSPSSTPPKPDGIFAGILGLNQMCISGGAHPALPQRHNCPQARLYAAITFALAGHQLSLPVTRL
jgi:hypothetical protein